MKIAVFKADITPPIGSPINGGLSKPVVSIEHRLYAKGFILQNASRVCAVCALDYAGLCNSSYSLFKEKIAERLHTSPDNVAVQCVHQHTAPAPDSDAQDVIDGMPDLDIPACVDRADLLSAVDKTATAAESSAVNMNEVTHVGTSWSAVDRVASNRRVATPDRKIITRWSACQDIELQAAPEGLIDGFLRTVSFYQSTTPLVNIHYYATHPQSYWGDGRISGDVPGIARERLENETGVFQIYFTGCAGNITMGKYNTGTTEHRELLANRLYQAMLRSVKNVKPGPADDFKWANVKMEFPLRCEEEFTGKFNSDVLHRRRDGNLSQAAMLVALINRPQKQMPFEISCLSIGKAVVLHLPGEPFIEYQLWAQDCAKDAFVAVAGYGDCAPWYLCTDGAYKDDGGFEQTWSFIAPAEQYLKDKIWGIIAKMTKNKIFKE